MATATPAGRTALAPGRRRAARVLAGAQFGYTAWFAAAAYLALARAAHFAGHYYVPAQGDQYTADADVNSGWPWASAVITTAALGPLLAAVSIVVSSCLLVMLGYRRGHRALWLTLLGSTVAVVATVAVGHTSAGSSVINWVLD